MRLESKIFWVKKKISSDRISLKIVYVYKNRITGELKQDLGPGIAVGLSTLDDSYIGTTVFNNSSAIFVSGPPKREFKLKVSNGVNKGTIVTFK